MERTIRRPAPVVCSQVITESWGATLAGALLLLTGVLALGSAGALLGQNNRASGLALVLGLGLLALVWQLALRGSHPLLLSLTRESLHLAPTGRSISQGVPAETIPLTGIVAYKHWLRLNRLRVFAQYHLRLELADGRVLHLADRPGVLPTDNPPGAVRLNEVVVRLARWVPPGTIARPLFYQTPLARTLWWASVAALPTALLLLWLGYVASGSFLLALAVTYAASYYLGRDAAGTTPAKQHR